MDFVRHMREIDVNDKKTASKGKGKKKACCADHYYVYWFKKQKEISRIFLILV